MSNKIVDTTSQVMLDLLSSAASFGSLARQEMQENEARLVSARTDATAANEAVDSAVFAESAFGTPGFRRLAQLARVFGKSFNDPDSQEARDAAMAAAKTFGETMTGKNDASGGTFNGYAHVLRLGESAENVRDRVQERIVHWKERRAEAADMKPADAKKHKADCDRFLQVRGPSLKADGSIPVTTDESTGKVTPSKVKHNGRPVKPVTLDDGRTLTIGYKAATNRNSQMAELALMVHEHGTGVLRSDILDAFLDTGGKFEGAKAEPGIRDFANDALTALEKLVMLGAPSGTPDVAYMKLVQTVLNRLAQTGEFSAAVVAENVVALAPTPEPTPEPEPEIQAPSVESIPDPAPESIPAPETEAPAPLAPAAETGNAPKRARRAK